MRVEPLPKEPIPVMAHGEADEREHIKAKPDNKYFLSEYGWTLLIGLPFGRFVF